MKRNKRLLMGGAAGVLVLLVVTLIFGGDEGLFGTAANQGGDLTPSSRPDDGTLTNQFVTKVSQLRCQNGLPPVIANGLLIQAAQGQSAYMAETGDINAAHTGRGGSTIESRILATGYDYEIVRENTGRKKPTSVDQIFQDWVNSAGHKANMLDPNMQEIGVSLAFSADGTAYWTMDLGKKFDGVGVGGCQ